MNSGHCKKFEPIYKEASNDPDLQNINFGKIDATAEKNLAKRFGVSRFPTIKFFENGLDYKYSGDRTLASLKKMGLAMLEPVIKQFSLDAFNQANSRFTVQFVYIANDKNKNIKHADNEQALVELINTRFRPHLIFYSISYSQFIAKYATKHQDFIKQSMKMDVEQMKKEFNQDEGGGSVIYAIAGTPSLLKNKQLRGEVLDGDMIEKFIKRNQYAPMIELELTNYKELVENCKYFAIVFIKGDKKKIRQNALKF